MISGRFDRLEPELEANGKMNQPERRTHNYVRHGTLDLFPALNAATGGVIARCKPQHRAQDFAFLREIE